MSIIRRTTGYCLVALLAGVGLANCGSSGHRNDQGTSFLALGYYEIIEDELVPIGAIDAAISTVSSAAQATGRLVDGRIERPLIGFENRLSAQFIRLTRVDCAYDIPGASVAIPATATVQGSVIAPAEYEDGAEVPVAPDPNPDNDPNNEAGGVPNFVYVRVSVVTPDLFAFINNNRNSLPEAPFVLNATCTGVGVTQAGRVMDSNAVSIPVYFFEEAEGPTNPDTGLGDGAGGTLLDSSSSSSSSGSAVTSADAPVDDNDNTDDGFVF